MNLSSSLKVLVIVLLLSLHSSLYFKLIRNEEKCIYEEIYSDTTIVVVYKLLNTFPFINAKEDETKISFTVRNEENNEQLFEFKEKAGNAKFSFHIPEFAKIAICSLSNYDPWFKASEELDLKLLIHTNLDEVDLDAATNKEFKGLNEELSKIKSEFGRIKAIQKAEQSQEEKFTEVQQSTSTVIMLISALQILIVVILGFVQIKIVKRMLNSM